ncbi:hypothetical protein [Clostridium fungisolvens]|uniref:Uncharacterized protein n=1 Tax=Clostridium fungisolvens TaxID=1604897 RepID=A0A6V8SN78_9CLOT|nr:hypothetical protein [Clostridium fungisolvens]GFP78241.1 hypothetical protein bsdtw1_04448 [Clostridium fungisolvens]
MGGITTDNIILLLVALILLYLVFKFIKGIIKTIITIILILTLGVSAYNILIAKKSVGDEINRYKIDYAYFNDVRDISSEAKQTVDDIENNKNIVQNINKLSELRNKAQALKHSSDLDAFHSKYINTFDGIIIGCKGYSTAKQVDEQTKKIDELKKDLNMSIKDIVSAR